MRLVSALLLEMSHVLIGAQAADLAHEFKDRRALRRGLAPVVESLPITRQYAGDRVVVRSDAVALQEKERTAPAVASHWQGAEC